MTTVDPRTTAARLMDRAALERTLTRLAHQVYERHPVLDGVVLIAIREGGVPIAERIAALLAAASGRVVPAGAIDVGPYRDDRPRPARRAAGAIEPLAVPGGEPRPEHGVSVDGATVVLVDDVVHTGRTLRAALDLLADHGRPAAVEPCVLFDRGQRELPLRAVYVGRNVPVSPLQWIEVAGWDAPPHHGGAAYLVERR